MIIVALRVNFGQPTDCIQDVRVSLEQFCESDTDAAWLILTLIN